MISCK